MGWGGAFVISLDCLLGVCFLLFLEIGDRVGWSGGHTVSRKYQENIKKISTGGNGHDIHRIGDGDFVLDFGTGWKEGGQRMTRGEGRELKSQESRAKTRAGWIV